MGSPPSTLSPPPLPTAQPVDRIPTLSKQLQPTARMLETSEDDDGGRDCETRAIGFRLIPRLGSSPRAGSLGHRCHVRPASPARRHGRSHLLQLPFPPLFRA